jgi:hypothetical protein
MVALQNPKTQEIESEPEKIKHSPCFLFKVTSRCKPQNKSIPAGANPSNYPWDDKANRGIPDPFTFESKITSSEKEGISERQWLHSSI